MANFLQNTSYLFERIINERMMHFPNLDVKLNIKEKES